jgi:hypothetical protein
VFHSSSEWRETPTLLDFLEGANLNHWIGPTLSKGPNGVNISLPSNSSEDRNRSSFRNVVFPGYLKFRTMGEILKLSHSE